MVSRKFFTYVILGFACALILAVGSVYAIDTGLQTTAQNAGLLDTAPTDVPTLIGNVIGTALSMIGVLFFLLMLYGGILWMTARGNEEQTRKALDTIIAAAIGIVIVLASYALTNFVFNSTKGGGAAGNGAAAVAVDWNQFDNCEAVAGWSCKDISACGLVGDDVAAQRDSCANSPVQCQLGKCVGGNNIVCCKD